MTLESFPAAIGMEGLSSAAGILKARRIEYDFKSGPVMAVYPELLREAENFNSAQFRGMP